MTNDHSLADQAFEPLVAAAAGNARALLALAGRAFARSNSARAYQLACDAMALEPDNPAIMAMARDYISRSVPRWHVPMVRDDPRNSAFLGALERAVTPEKRVLDIGSGSGLLAMMAARAGARIVHSCEMNPSVAEVAQEIVRENGLADAVTVHAKSSRQLDVERDLGGKADIVVSEIIGIDLVCEAVLSSMRDVMRRLAKPDAQIIPRGGDIRVALAWWDKLDGSYLDDVCGFDVTAFNRLLPTRFIMPVGDSSLHVRGEATSLYAFDFTTTERVQDDATMELVATGGPVNGVVQWFRLQMDETASLENEPGPGAESSWGCQFFPLREVADLAPGDRISVGATVAGDRLRLWQE